MIETIEKIPALAPLNKIIDEINELLGQKEAQGNADKPIEYWIAGGAITAAITGTEINDYDIFSPTPEKLKQKLQEAGAKKTFEHAFFTNFWVDGKKLSLKRSTSLSTVVRMMV